MKSIQNIMLSLITMSPEESLVFGEDEINNYQAARKRLGASGYEITGQTAPFTITKLKSESKLSEAWQNQKEINDKTFNR